MKKVLLGALVLGAVSMTSCKKKITCECVNVALEISEKTTKAKSGEEKEACLDVADKVLAVPVEACVPK